MARVIPFYDKADVYGAAFGQWAATPFTAPVYGTTSPEVRFRTAEHYMMAGKAQVFGDAETLAKILATASPRVAKRLGRAVKPFDAAVWDLEGPRVVLEGSLAKFRQNAAERALLLATGDAVLVEASPTDRIWGAGIPASDARINTPGAWPGKNLLGQALMAARATLADAGARG